MKLNTHGEYKNTEHKVNSYKKEMRAQFLNCHQVYMNFAL